MTFVRANTVNGNRYYSLVETYRDAGQVRQRRIAYLGRYPTIPAAIDGLEVEIEAAEAVVKRMTIRAGAMVSQAGRRWLTVGGLPRPDANYDPSIFRDLCRTHWQAKDGANKAMKRADRLRERLAELRRLRPASSRARRKQRTRLGRLTLSSSLVPFLRSEALKPPPPVVL